MKQVDHEATISFPSIVPDTPVLKWRSETITNDERIAALRREIEDENAESTQVHEFLLGVNSIIHQNFQKMQSIRSSFADPGFKSQALTEILTQHNALITEHLSGLPKSESERIATLTGRISSLRRQIEHEKSFHPERTFRRDELDRVKRKSRFYKREYGLLHEFVRKELELEREEDDAAVEGLKRTIGTLSKELEIQRSTRRRTQEDECARVFHQIDVAKGRLDERTTVVAALESARGQTRAAIEWRTEAADRLTRELAILRTMLS